MRFIESIPILISYFVSNFVFCDPVDLKRIDHRDPIDLSRIHRRDPVDLRRISHWDPFDLNRIHHRDPGDSNRVLRRFPRSGMTGASTSDGTLKLYNVITVPVVKVRPPDESHNNRLNFDEEFRSLSKNVLAGHLVGHDRLYYYSSKESAIRPEWLVRNFCIFKNFLNPSKIF